MRAADRKAPRLTRDVFRAANSRGGSGQCSLGAALARLSAPDRAETLAAIADAEIQATAISTVLRTRKVVVSAETVQRHRRRGCTRCALKGRA